jgi:hypothetical protein
LFFSNAAIHLQIAALSSLVANVAKSTETTNVIDVGAGQVIFSHSVFCHMLLLGPTCRKL